MYTRRYDQILLNMYVKCLLFAGSQYCFLYPQSYYYYLLPPLIIFVCMQLYIHIHTPLKGIDFKWWKYINEFLSNTHITCWRRNYFNEWTTSSFPKKNSGPKFWLLKIFWPNLIMIFCLKKNQTNNVCELMSTIYIYVEHV